MAGHLALMRSRASKCTRTRTRACVGACVLEAGSGPMFARQRLAQTARTWVLVMSMIRWHATLTCLGLDWPGSLAVAVRGLTKRASGGSIIAVIFSHA